MYEKMLQIFVLESRYIEFLSVYYPEAHSYIGLALI